MTLPKKPLPKVTIREMTPAEIAEDVQSLKDVAYRILNRGQSPLEHCFDMVRINTYPSCDCDCHSHA